MLQLRLGSERAPLEATFAQHGDGERLRRDQLELVASADGPTTVAYPARGSHAPRPRAGTFEAPVLPDHNDGRGPLVRPRLVAVGDDGPGWVLWPGRWGATRRRESFELDSPRGPREHPQWWDPLELHREARPWVAPRADGAPPALRLRARREGDVAVVSYRFDEPADGAGEPARIVVAPFDDRDEPSGCRPFALEGREGSFALQLPADRDWTGVRGAATSDRGAAGATVSAEFEEERAG